MKRFFVVLSLSVSAVLFSQSVTLSKGVKVNQNNDKFFYKVDSEIPNAEYLGEIQVDGFSKNDADTFSLIYKKAKTLGANAFSLNQKESIDGLDKSLDSEHYQLNLYYLPSDQFKKEDNTVYIFSYEPKNQNIRIDNKKRVLQPKHYIKLNLVEGETSSISTKKILGSKVMLQGKAGQPVQYFMVTSFNLHSDQSGTNGGIFLKSGDVTPVEKSFAQFLQLIYKEQK